MDFRRDVLPAVLALLLSLAVHAAIFGVDLSVVLARPAPEIDTVVVEYLPAAGSHEAVEAPNEKTAAAPEPKRAPVPPTPPERRPRAAPPAPPQKKSDPPSSPRAPPKPSAPRAPPQPEAPPPSKPPTPAAPAEPKASKPGETVTPPPRLADLMPNPRDLAAYARNDGPPDPAGAKAREATLTLGTTDIRYRGYLDGVETAIDLSWSQRWKEALLAAGRAGSVVVRFTLTPGGNIESVEVVKSSGSSILDDEASNAVRRAPLPPFPAHWTIERLHLLAQFDYRFE